MLLRRGIGGKNGGNESVYPELYAVVGSQVPDYRGMFLRGYGGNSANLGVQQEDAIRNIMGTMGSYAQSTRGNHNAEYIRFAQSSGAFWRKYRSSGLFSVGGTAQDEFYISEFDASRVVPTASENRPINKAVRYLIRAKS